MLVLGRLAEASLRIGRDHLSPLFKEFGLRPGEFDVLATLRRSGPPYALSPTALYEATMVSSGAMTGRVDRLQTVGLVERRPDPDDRRAILVCLSEEGRELMDELIERHVANQQWVLSGLDAKECDDLARLLEKLLATLPSGEA